jgi:hypothetical protein
MPREEFVPTTPTFKWAKIAIAFYCADGWKKHIVQEGMFALRYSTDQEAAGDAYILMME